MSLRDEDLRAVYQRVTAGSRTCPDADTLVRAAEGALAGGERESILSHIESCSRCAEDARIAFSAHGAVPRAGRASRGLPMVRGWLAIAAAAAIVSVGALFLLRKTPPSDEGALRGVAESGQRTRPPASAHLPHAPLRLEWENAPKSGEYEIVLFDSESTRIWSSGRIREPRAQLPEDVRRRVGAGTYYWRVFYTPGTETLKSPLFGFVIDPAA